jgi:hypothetical protein
MATSEAVQTKPLWLSIEEKFLELDLSGNAEASIQQIAGELDEAGYNVSNLGGSMLQLRWAMDEMRSVGRPLMQDINDAIGTLTLEDVAAPYTAVDKIIGDISAAWPKLKNAQYRVEVARMVTETRLQLLIAKAKGMEGDTGIRMLIEEKVEDDVITGSLELPPEKLAQVKADIKKELAERARVETLLEKVADKADDEKVRHLIDNNVAEALILEIAKVDQSVIDGVNKAMEEELREKQRLAEEEAARKKAEAEGPSLDTIPADQMIDYIDSIREILEFSDQEKEIRVMCEQSAIPKVLVDIAVSDPDKLDELEKAAEG